MRRIVLSLSLVALVILIWPATALAATLPGLGTAGNYAVIASTTVTNTGPSWITGQVALSPSTASSITGFPPGTSGHRDAANAAAANARAGLTAAYLNAAGQTPCTAVSGGILGGKTLVAGIYCSGTMGLTGTLTLNGGGVYIFQIGSTLITASAARVRLINGAQPCDIFWQVGSSATIATSTTFVGNIMALTSIAMQTGATLNGRAMARNGAVTLDTNRIIQPSGCGFPVPTYVAPPAANILPATLGVPFELRGSFPWMLVIGAGAGLGAAVLMVASRRRRRTA